ncbi:MAG: MBL fold metallo-hydrolase [Bacteroidia bacterium]|nr:MBL fold metallo-hydrolase [Bacteroidia bacterium]
MKLTFLGTGTSTGNPALLCSCATCLSKDPKDNRLRSSVLVEDQGTSLLIDCGPDFRQQALRANIRHIDAVLVTHEHYDHLGGLDDLRPYCSIHEMPLYAVSRILNHLQVAMPYSFRENPYPGVPLFDLRPVTLKEFRINHLEIIPIEVFHHKLPVIGYRIGDLTYLTDFNSILPKELEKVKGSKVLIIDALRVDEHISHNTLQQALDLIDALRPERSYLIHMSHDMGIQEEVEPTLPKGVFFSYDGLVLTL